MKRSPKDTLKSIQTVATAWAQLCSKKAFSGMTLDVYREIIRPSLDARTEIAALAMQMKLAIARRNAADKVSFAASQRVVCGVLADRQEGDDGVLYSAMGYVRRSERRSGLVRKRNCGIDAPRKPAIRTHRLRTRT